MRPIHLRFAGLRSYRAQTEIDFSTLDLFAIIGDTGAGKSTVIEALCLALYGKKSWTGGDARLADLITDGENTMRIELTFGVGAETWTVTRARHRNSSAPIDRLIDADGLPVADGKSKVNERIEQLIGLTFSQFTQAVVLPQGRFDTLLRATESDRNKILESLLDLGEVVAARRQADTTLVEWRTRTTTYRARRDMLPADPVAEAAHADAELRVAQRRNADLAEARNTVDALETTHGTLVVSRDDLKTALRQVRPRPADGTSQMRELATEWQSLADQRTLATAEVAARSDAISALDREAAVALDGFASRDDLVTARERIRHIATALPAALRQFAELQTDREALGDTPPIASVDDSFTSAVSVAEAHRSLCEDAEKKATARLASAREAHRRFVADATRADDLAARATALAGEATATSGRSSKATNDADRTQAELDALVADERKAELAHAAREAAATCAPGEPCPICERPLPDGFRPTSSDAALIDLRQRVAAARTRHRRSADAAAELSATAVRLQAEADTIGDSATEAAAARDKAATEAADLGADLGTHEADAAVATLAAAAATCAQATAAADEELTAARESLAEERARVDAAVALHQDQLARVTRDVAATDGVIAEHRRYIASLPPPWSERLAEESTTELSDLIGQLGSGVDSLERIALERDALAAQRDTARRQLSTAEGRIASGVKPSIRELLRSVSDHLRSVAEIQALLPTAPSEGGTPFDEPQTPVAADDLVTAIERAFAVAAETEGLGALHLAEAADKVDDAERMIQVALGSVGCDTPEALHTAFGVSSNALEHAVAEASAARGRASQADRLDRILAVAAPFTANLELLADALRSKNFIAHLVDARERELLAEAARRLREITNERFTFAKDFGVVSIASGEKRPPDALSGGERFQAALALALALVEIASRGGGQLDAVFVDEGFGSLDTNTLDVALDTLGKVAGGGKSVALISHLQRVAEYVDTVLHVTKDDVLGSRIEVLDSDAKDRLMDDELRSGLTG